MSFTGGLHFKKDLVLQGEWTWGDIYVQPHSALPILTTPLPTPLPFIWSTFLDGFPISDTKGERVESGMKDWRRAVLDPSPSE